MRTITRLPVARFERLIAALTALALLPVWLFRFFPTQDGPSHLYNAFVLAHLGDAASTTLRDFYVINARPFPNWTMYLVMAPLTRVLPPLVVQQIVISLCVIAIPAAVVYLQKSFKGAVDAMGLLGVLLAYNAMLFLGFFNFVLGAALFLVILGFRARRGGRLPALYALLAAAYFTHAMAFAAAVASIVLFDVLQRRWRVILELAPALLVLNWDSFRRFGAAREWRPIGWHIGNVVTLNPFVYLDLDAHVWIARAAFLLIALCVVRGVWARAPGAKVSFISAALFLCYCFSPWGYGAGGWSLGGWVSDRFLFLTLLTLPAWVTVPKKAAYAFVVLIVCHFALTARDVDRFHKRISLINNAMDYVRPHSTLYRLGGHAETLHVGSYLALQQDVVSLDNYEAHLPDFPVAFRRDVPKRPPDYLVVWSDARVRNVSAYRILYSAGDIRLFGRAGL